MSAQDKYTVSRTEKKPFIRKEPRNMTPRFMEYALIAWNKGYKIGWAVYRIAEEFGISVQDV